MSDKKEPQLSALSAPPLEGNEASENLITNFGLASIDTGGAPSAPSTEAPVFINPVSQVELTVSARSLLNLDQLTKSDPLCVIFIQDSSTFGEWLEMGRTETIFNDLNPEWKTKFLLDYKFEERQMLQFMIYDKDLRKYSLDNHDFLGKLVCSLGEVVSASHSKFTRPLKLPSMHYMTGCESTITIASEEIGDCKKTVCFQMSSNIYLKNSLIPSTQEVFISISKQIADSTWILLHRTDRISKDNSIFPRVKLRYSSVCIKGNYECPLRFQLHLDKQSFRGKSAKVIGEVITNFIEISEMCQVGIAQFSMHDSQIRSSEKPTASLEIRNFEIGQQKTFIDYLHDGLELSFVVAIDFTASNGEPTRHSSLHYKHGKRDNPYVMTLKILGEIINDYSSSKQFYAYGFGAKGYPENNRVNHKFALNFKEKNPVCQGIEGILTSYYRALQRLKLFGPTCFAPIIREAIEVTKRSLDSSPEKYFVLLILTDGIVCDPETTINALVEASNFPLSVIIIGIGDEDFTAMEKLDSDEKLLKSRSGGKASRDIVQFVELKKYINFKSIVPINDGSKVALAKAVLAELPQQVVSWMDFKQEKLN